MVTIKDLKERIKAISKKSLVSGKNKCQLVDTLLALAPTDSVALAEKAKCEKKQARVVPKKSTPSDLEAKNAARREKAISQLRQVETDTRTRNVERREDTKEMELDVRRNKYFDKNLDVDRYLELIIKGNLIEEREATLLNVDEVYDDIMSGDSDISVSEALTDFALQDDSDVIEMVRFFKGKGFTEANIVKKMSQYASDIEGYTMFDDYIEDFKKKEKKRKAKEQRQRSTMLRSSAPAA